MIIPVIYSDWSGRSRYGYTQIFQVKATRGNPLNLRMIPPL